MAVVASGVLTGQTVTQITTGDADTCALDSAGLAYCWGSNVNGEVGDRTTIDRRRPVAVDTNGVLAGETLTQIVSAYRHTCALDSAGAAFCWGDDTYGQLGDGTTRQRDSPVAVRMTGVLAGKTLTQISTDYRHTCAVDSAGAAFCWGDNTYGQLGDGTTRQRDSPVAVRMTGVLAGKILTQIATGYYHTCALDSTGKAYCWGDDTYGELGDNRRAQDSLPVALDTAGVLAGARLAQLSAAGYHTCGLDSAGLAYCWGDNAFGETGNDTTTSGRAPTAVYLAGALAGVALTQISSGLLHTCALDRRANSFCWGDNTYGQLGDNTTTQRIVPVLVRTLPPQPPKAVAAVGGKATAATSHSACPPGTTGPGCPVASPLTPSIALTGLSSGFSLSGVPDDTPEQLDAVDMTVTCTDCSSGYDVTVQAESDLTAAPGITIPIANLEVRDSGQTPQATYQPLSAATPVLVHHHDGSSATDGDLISNDYEINIPNAPPGTYTTTLDYIATAP